MSKPTTHDTIIVAAKCAIKKPKELVNAIRADIQNYEDEEVCVEAIYADVIRNNMKREDIPADVLEYLGKYLAPKPVELPAGTELKPPRFEHKGVEVSPSVVWAEYRRDEVMCATFTQWRMLYNNWPQADIRAKIREKIRAKFGMRATMMVVYNWDLPVTDPGALDNLDLSQLVKVAITFDSDPCEFTAEWASTSIRLCLFDDVDPELLRLAREWVERYNFPIEGTFVMKD